jgi:hypothetical protein
MAWTMNINSILPGEDEIVIAGQLVFSSSYSTGGDGSGTFVTTNGANTAGWPDVKPFESVVHATRTPHNGNVQFDGGWIAVIVPVASNPIPKIKIINPSTQAELSAGAYPASITGATYHFMQLNYRKNL